MYFSGKEKKFGINGAIAEQNVTFNWCRCYCRDQAFSESFIRLHTLVCDMILVSTDRMPKHIDENNLHHDKLLGLIGVLSVTSVARGSPSVTCQAIADSASGEGFKLDSNTDIKENYPRIMGKPSF